MNKCPICGKEYDDPVKMAECIMNCDKKRKEIETKARLEAEMAEEKASQENVEKLYKAYRDAARKHVEKYKKAKITYNSSDEELIKNYLKLFNPFSSEYYFS